MQFCDGNSYNYGYIGSRATGSEAGDYLVAGPDWKGETPAGIKKVFRSSTYFSAAIYRTQLFDPADMENVIKVQDGYKVQPLSAYLKQPAPPPAPTVDFPKIDKRLAKTNFFEFLDFALQFAPAAAERESTSAPSSRTIGIGAGKTFNFKDLPLEQKLEGGARHEGWRPQKIDAAVATAGKNVNGWRVGAAGGDSAYFNGDWLRRAAVAKAGIYANDADEATYPFARTDSDDQPLDGAQARLYADLPGRRPAAGQRLLVGDDVRRRTQLLIKNPIDRYLINSPMLPNLKTNADGSLTIYVQNKSPGAGQGVELAAGA